MSHALRRKLPSSLEERSAYRPSTADLKKLPNRCGHVGEAASSPERAHLIPVENDERHFLSRVVGPAEGRIVAVIGSHDQEILRFDTL